MILKNELKMKELKSREGIYAIHGYEDREDYLNTLADDRGIAPADVRAIADLLGPEEDFDGLVGELEDYQFAVLLKKSKDGG
jgi:hypothetical protein